MKTVIFNGSPRRGGDTAALINEFKKYMLGECETIDAYSAGISPCIDCRACCEKPGCVIDDGMRRVYALTKECDIIVAASPINFSLPTGPLLSLFSRFQYRYCNSKFLGIKPDEKPKRGVILLAGGGDGSPEPAIEAAKTLLRTAGARGDIAVVLSGKTDELPAKDDKEALGAIKEIAREIYKN